MSDMVNRVDTLSQSGYTANMADENGVLKITEHDVTEANQLSLHCPICAGPVERNVEQAELMPVVCAACGTLYHRACWAQNGGKCAILGCSHTESRTFGSEVSTLRIDMSDIPSEAQVKRRNERLKRAERAKQRKQDNREPADPQSSGFWNSLFGRILRSIGFGGQR